MVCTPHGTHADSRILEHFWPVDPVLQLCIFDMLHTDAAHPHCTHDGEHCTVSHEDQSSQPQQCGSSLVPQTPVNYNSIVSSVEKYVYNKYL